MILRFLQGLALTKRPDPQKRINIKKLKWNVIFLRCITMKKRLQAIDFQDELYSCGYVRHQLNDIYLHCFNSPEEAARYLGVSVSTIYRYFVEGWPVAQARLMLLKHRGFMPTSKPWSGFRIYDDKLITPTGREFSAMDLTIPKMIESNDNWRLLMRNQKRLRLKR